MSRIKNNRLLRFSLTSLFSLVTVAAVVVGVYFWLSNTPPQIGATNDWIKPSDPMSFGVGLNHEFAVLLDSNFVDTCPSWPSSYLNPPVGAKKAIQIVRQRCTNRASANGINGLEWTLDSIELIPLDGGNGKWAWQISLDSPDEFDRFTALVMMDGALIGVDNGVTRSLAEKMAEPD